VSEEKFVDEGDATTEDDEVDSDSQQILDAIQNSLYVGAGETDEEIKSPSSSTGLSLLTCFQNA